MPGPSDTLVIGWRDLRDALELAGVAQRAARDALVLLVLTQFCDEENNGKPALSANAFGHATVVVLDELALSRRAYQGALWRLQRAGLLTVLLDSDALVGALEGDSADQLVWGRLEAWSAAAAPTPFPSMRTAQRRAQRIQPEASS